MAEVLEDHRKLRKEGNEYPHLDMTKEFVLSELEPKS
ncbi:MAG: hypothetical protein AOA66_1609 [Candidatus Bathyarchaeota archaeon BA2]|nr:MAG: hypothetical protein AOA66_1609 [Candidatus Bathyarchaeota archaeon BA2]